MSARSPRQGVRLRRPAIVLLAAGAIGPMLGLMIGLAVRQPPALPIPDKAQLRSARGPWLLINESRSLPRGLYRRLDAPVVLGSIVAVKPPPSAGAYLRAANAPEDLHLLKRVAAGPGDRVCVTRVAGDQARGGAPRAEPQTLKNGGRILLLEALETDAGRRPLPDGTGCRLLQPGLVFILGDGPRSFDSRYFGPAPTGSLSGPYVLAVPW